MIVTNSMIRVGKNSWKSKYLVDEEYEVAKDALYKLRQPLTPEQHLIMEECNKRITILLTLSK